MGNIRFSDSDWSTYSSSVSHKPREEIFTRSTIKSTKDPRTSMDPKTIQVRESRDSDANPNSTPINIAFDVTGSMGDIPNFFVKKGLGKLMKEVYDRQPVSDPHIMCMAVGDAYYDRSPLQVSQYEADIRIAKQLEEFYLEGGGGGNRGESYNLAWLFAANKTSTDCFEKRGKKGLLFTIGDEPPLPTVTKQHAKEFLGINIDRDLSSAKLLEMVRKQYDVYHVIVEQGDYCQHHKDEVVRDWNALLGQGYVLRLSDYTKLSEVVISAIQMNSGMDTDAIVKSWSGKTSLVVADALPKVPVAARGAGRGKGIVRFSSPKM